LPHPAVLDRIYPRIKRGFNRESQRQTSASSVCIHLCQPLAFLRKQFLLQFRGATMKPLSLRRRPHLAVLRYLALEQPLPPTQSNTHGELAASPDLFKSL